MATLKKPYDMMGMEQVPQFDNIAPGDGYGQPPAPLPNMAPPPVGYDQGNPGPMDDPTKGNLADATMPKGGYDYEKFRKGWAYGGKGFGSQTNIGELQQFIKDNPAFASGVTLRGEKVYDPTGKFMFDAIGNFTGGDPSQMTRIALEGNSKPKLKKPPVVKGPKGAGMLIEGAPKGTKDTEVIKLPKAGGPKPPVSPPPLPPQQPIDDGGKVFNEAPVDPKVPQLDMDGILKQLSGMFPGGMFNQNLVNSRVDAATGALEKGRKSRLANNRAALAERGLLGDGAEATAINRMDSDLYDQYTNAVSDIYGNESAQADQRMMQALSTAAGLSSEQARQAIDKFRATNENNYNMGNLDLGKGRLGLDTELGRGNLKLGQGRLSLDDKLGTGNLALGNRNASINEMLGKGQLALGNLNAQNNYNLGLGNLGLNRDQLMWQMQNGDTDSLIRLLQLYMGGANNTQGGYK